MYKELRTCPQVFTLETTFSGIDKGPHQGQHITTKMLEQMGADVLRGFLLQQNLHMPKELESVYN